MHAACSVCVGVWPPHAHRWLAPRRDEQRVILLSPAIPDQISRPLAARHVAPSPSVPVTDKSPATSIACSLASKAKPSITFLSTSTSC